MAHGAEGPGRSVVGAIWGSESAERFTLIGNSVGEVGLIPLMKLQKILTANSRISNIEPQNVEGWNRFDLSLNKMKV